MTPQAGIGTVAGRATPPGIREVALPEEAATAALGARLAAALRPGDVVALRGGLGAGKSALARAAIRALLGRPEADVPSPSYTLVNVYRAARAEVWHADLYRLGGPEEAEELGLFDAPGETILIVEWPDRLGARLPGRRLEIALSVDDPGSAGAAALEDRAPRAARIEAFGSGWGAALSALGEGADA